jgi:hypothetical protein
MEVKSFTYRKNLFGTYYKQGFLNVQKMESSQAICEKRLHHRFL